MSQNFSRNESNYRGHGGQSVGSNADAASPACMGESFYNPYTFIPFPDKDHPPVRRKPTPMSIDEIEKDRFTGVIRLKIRTCSPLLTCEAEPVSPTGSAHKRFTALTIGKDVIVPATSVRGSLRTMMTAIVGGTLGYLDNNLWLCQGRDAVLGPATKNNRKPPTDVFLGRVVQPGDASRSGVIRLGTTKLVLAENLRKIIRPNAFGVKSFDDLRPGQKQKGDITEVWIDNPENPTQAVAHESEQCPWLLKLSGMPVGRSERKKEGAFRANDRELVISKDLWTAYAGRNRNGDFGELRKGHLVWLEPQTPTQDKIETADDIKSLQWARWGRHGQSFRVLMEAHHKHLLPDSLNPDGLVDEITDLFGHVPLEDGAAPAFAGRIRPSNLVFHDRVSALQRGVTLAPLMQPHPGCVAFYHDYFINGNDTSDLDAISQSWSLRGYKVYRNTKERGADAPWNYGVQGTYKGVELNKPAQQNCNKTCDLLTEGQVGELELTCLGLSKRELALLILVCTTCDWRLGGGKPLGLGHCHVDFMSLVDESGCRCEFPADWPDLIEDAIWDRRDWYNMSQEPVDKLRYPRAVKSGNHATQAGHLWFSRHAGPRQQTDPSEPATGLRTLWTDGLLKQKVNGKEQIHAQALPLITDKDGKLYGYDCTTDEIKTGGTRTLVSKVEPFSAEKHGGASREHRPNYGQSAESRQANRDRRADPR